MFWKALAALTVAAASALPAATVWPIQLAAKTVLIVHGNDNPSGEGIEDRLNGAFNPSNANFHYAGYSMSKVSWLADSFDGFPGYAVSQNDGLVKLHAAITAYGNVDDADEIDKLVVVGYSSGALVAIREMTNLDNQVEGAPAPDQIEFVVVGNPQRPNGGIFTRFPGLQFGALVFEGPNPDTRYGLTDISYEYDPISDFPAYPLLPLTLLNSLAGWQFLHISYAGEESDPAHALDDPNLTYYDAEKGIRYLTIAAPHLPLLIPAYRLIDAVPILRPVVEPLLKLVEPTLKVLVDLGYNRDVPVGTELPARLLPSHDPAKVLQDLTNSFAAGLTGAWTSITGATSPDSDTELAVAASTAAPDLENPATEKRSARRSDVAERNRADDEDDKTADVDAKPRKSERRATNVGTEDRESKADDQPQKVSRTGSRSVRDSDTRRKARADAA